jgi:hypothetical protein
MVVMCVNVARFAGRSLALQVFSRARWWLSLVNPNAWRIHCPPEASSVCSQRGGWGARAEMRACWWRAELVSTHGERSQAIHSRLMDLQIYLGGSDGAGLTPKFGLASSFRGAEGGGLSGLDGPVSAPSSES